MKKPSKLRILRGGPWFLPAPSIPVYYEDPKHPSSQILRERCGLDALRERANGELDLFFLLQDHVKRLMVRHGWRFQLMKKKPIDALEILDAVESGYYMHCYYHAKLFCQCCEVLGYPARVVGARKQNLEIAPEALHGNNGHEIAEVWSNTMRKWVLIDCDTNSHYERAGVPLSITELCRACHGEDEQSVDWVLGDYQSEHDRTLGADGLIVGTQMTPEQSDLAMRRFVRDRVLDYYQIVLAAGRNDLFSHPKASPELVGFAPSPATPPLYTDGMPFAEKIKFMNDEKVFNWSVNETALSLRLHGADQAAAAWEWTEETAVPQTDCSSLCATLTHSMPYFDHFEYRTDADASWRRCGETLEWRLHTGENRMEAAAVNTMGIRGSVANAVVLLEWSEQ
jgi:hypothetical protein